ncbi:MAG TPA: hypothetical protein VNB22_02390 [Pyrinomonadaceae bacterium]|jgi:hypothetical protein|nr:hypothetical protein [Pyrinomonadaceae bacterium]
MKKMMWNAAAFCLVVGVLCFSAISTRAVSKTENLFLTTSGDQDFELVNHTGVEIYALYVTPHSANKWGSDVLGVDTLPDGESVEIKFSWKEKAKYWDIRVEDEDGAFIEWEKLNLLEISTVQLFYKNGKATAIVE